MNEKKVKKASPGTSPEQKIPDAAPGGEEKEKVFHDVGELSPVGQKLVQQMLMDGATFEDTIAAVSESADAKLTIRALENYFRGSKKIQQERVRRQVKLARDLKQALRNPNSAHAELAEAVLITGLLGLRSQTAASGMQNAMRLKDQHDNFLLRQESHMLRVRKLESDNRMLDARLKNELEKHKLLEHKFESVKRELEQEGKSQRLGPETMKRIQEIYGLLTDSSPKVEPHGPAAET